MMWLLLIFVQCLLMWSQLRILRKDPNGVSLNGFVSLMMFAIVPIFGLIVSILLLIINIMDFIKYKDNADEILDKLLLINRK